MTDAPLPPPPGFRPIPIEIGFIGVNGPLFLKYAEDVLTLGFRVEERHCNPMGIAHGGMMCTFADMLMPFTILADGKIGARFLPTVHMSQEFLAPAPKGAWVEGTGQRLRATKNLVFGQCLVTADGEPCLRASGIFKMGPETGGHGIGEMLRRMAAEG
ncbi:MAG: PaaI family thioesterase [Hyphomonadaceae bacterium]|nr:PaaI family thioesterase [Hyphomonadaceae bacterium]